MKTSIFAVLIALCSNGLLNAGEYLLKITKIEMKNTPQTGDWRAGVSLRQKSEPDNRDSWHGKETTFEGPDAVLPVNLELGGLDAAEQVSLFIGLDDDNNDAGTNKAEDQLNIDLKVFPTGSKDKVYDYSEGDWAIRVHYTLSK